MLNAIKTCTACGEAKSHRGEKMMSETVTLQTGISYCWEPTKGLRFVLKDGKRVLQQCWWEYRQDSMGYVFQGREEWRDVPFEATP
jgi:hypothetical protein